MRRFKPVNLVGMLTLLGVLAAPSQSACITDTDGRKQCGPISPHDANAGQAGQTTHSTLLLRTPPQQAPAKTNPATTLPLRPPGMPDPAAGRTSYGKISRCSADPFGNVRCR